MVDSERRPGGIGARVRRVEDADLIRGRSAYVGDLHLHGAVSMAVVRSPVAHGLLGSIDVDEASSSPGVIALFTARDVIDDLGAMPRIPPRVSYDEAVVPYLQPLLAEDRVRYVGEPVAVVVAEDRYLAEDAAGLVFAEIDPLPVVLDDGADEPLFPEGNRITTLAAGFGDVDQVFAGADIVVEAKLSVGRHSGVPMEGRGIVVEPDPDTGRLRVHGATKVPHWNLEATARLLGLDPGMLLMQEMAVGGGFGVRGELYPEDVLAVWLARRLGRPVSWLEDRREHLVAANHSREQRHLAAIAGTADGRILAIRSEFWVDVGAYVRTHGIRVPDLTLSMLPGPYELEAYRGRAHCMVSNKTPAGTYRAPGRYESSFIRERLIDLYAARVGYDRIDVRRLNLIPPDRLPYRRPLASTGEPMTFGEGDYPGLLDKVAAAAPIAEVEQRRTAGESVGWGIAFFLEKSGLGPWEEGSVEVDPNGTVHVLSGGTSVGQGYRTVMAQIVADRLQVPVEQVVVDLLDTDRVPAGIGSYASRTTVTAGSALVRASEEVVDLARRVVADAGEVAVDDLVLVDGGLEVAGSPGFRWTLGEIAGMLTEERAQRLDLSPRLAANARFDVERVVYPYGAVWAAAGVDPDTGRVRLERLVIGYDIGRAVNPTLVEGQMHGGAAQAVGGALYEVFRYDQEGNPLATSFADYLIPTLAEVPPVTPVISEDHPTSTNPLGVKGAGEAGVPGVAAAIASAVEQAVGRVGWVRGLPIHPADVRQAITDPAAPSRSLAANP